jgi:TonB family protein
VPEPRRQPNFDSASRQQVEDAQKYRLYIEPVYPRRARLASKEASVDVELTFRPDGTFKNAIIKACDTPGWGFEQAVLASALEATLQGHAQREITVRTTIKFRLE